MSRNSIDGNTTTPVTTSPPLADAQQHIRLACQACQRKKIKCDRTFPCGQCTKSSLTCVPSSRKQRTRHAGKRAVDGELRTRIAKLESLVESLSGDPQAAFADKPAESIERSPPTRTNSIELEAPGVGKYVAANFWSSLTNEFAAIREALEDEDEADGTPDANDSIHLSPNLAQSPDQYATVNHDILVCPPGRIFIMPGVFQNPEPAVQPYLIEVFFKNVERMLKIFHRPTLRAAIEDGAEYLGHSAGSLQHDALRQLVWFSALNSLSEDEVLSLTGQPKVEVVPKFRRYVGILISQLDLCNTSDLATLQLLAVFITVCRSSDSSRRTWTSLALLVRNAQAIYLNQDDLSATPYIRELRRRLWHYIRLLDKFCALDRGSSQLIKPEDFSIPYPLQTNDDLFGPESTEIPDLTGQVTDTTFAVMCFESCNTIEALLIPEVTPTGLTWEARRTLALDMGRELEKKYLHMCDLTDEFQRFQHAIGKSICSAMIVRAVRPMQRHMSSVPPPVDSPEVLKLAVDNLEASYVIFADPAFEPWRWMRWVPWHCLAVALAGLCSLRGTPETIKAWALVEPAYNWCRLHIADSEDGMLWRPLTKLYKKAVAFRDSTPTALSMAKRNTIAAPYLPPGEADSVGISSETLEATSKWAQPWSERTRAFGAEEVLPPFTASNMNDPIDAQSASSHIDYLSSNLSSMSPFGFQSLPSTIPPYTNGSVPNDASWGDWGQMLDEFQNPLQMNAGTMDMDILMNEWNFNAPMQQTQL